jgi:hypothetical protein
MGERAVCIAVIPALNAFRLFRYIADMRQTVRARDDICGVFAHRVYFSELASLYNANIQSCDVPRFWVTIGQPTVPCGVVDALFVKKR